MLFKADSDLLCAVESGHKQIHSLAGYICDQAGKHGLMDINVQDHSLEPKVKALCLPGTFSPSPAPQVFSSFFTSSGPLSFFKLFQAFSPAQDGQPRHFRYSVNPKTTMLALTPKKLDDIDMTTVRGSMIGAAFAGRYDKIPRTDIGRVVWEVFCLKLHFKFSIFRFDPIWLPLFQFVFNDQLNSSTITAQNNFVDSGPAWLFFSLPCRWCVSALFQL